MAVGPDTPEPTLPAEYKSPFHMGGAWNQKHPNFLGTVEARQFMFLLVEKDTGKVHDHIVLPVHVGKYSKSPVVRHKLTYTASGAHLDMPVGDSRGFVNFNISGVSGLRPEGREEGAHDGASALRAVESFFDIFLDQNTSLLALEFMDLGCPASDLDPVGDSAFRIVPKGGVQITRDSRRVGLYGFSISFTGYERVDRKRDRDVVELDKRESLLRTIREFTSFTSEFDFDSMMVRWKMFISPAIQISAGLADVSAFLDRWSRGIDEFIGYNADLIASTVDDLSKIVSLPLSTMTDRKAWMRRMSRRGIDKQIKWMEISLKRVLNTFKADPGISHQTPDKYVIGPRVKSADGGPDAVMSASGELSSPPSFARSGAPRSSERTQMSSVSTDPSHKRPGDRAGLRIDPNSGGTTLVRVGPGMNIFDFVPNGYTVAYIIKMNNLRYPFVDSSRVRPDSDPAPAAGDQRVAYLSEYIRVPVVSRRESFISGASSPSASIVDRSEAAESEDGRVLGTDILTDDEGNLVLDENDGDLRVVSGLDNLFQGIKRRLVCPIRGLPYAPQFGSGIGLGGWSSSESTRATSILVNRAIMRDERVESVDRIVVDVYDGKITVSFDLTVAEGTPAGRVTLSI